MPDARSIISGTPGERWVNDTDRPWYQLEVSGTNTCAICYQYNGKLSRMWALPLHPGCRCKQRLVKPGATAPAPFVDYQKLVKSLEPHEQVKVMGSSNFKLWKAGIVDWDDVVTPSRIRSLAEVVAREKLTIKQMTEVGVSPAIAERAHGLVHTDEHAAADAHRRELVKQIAGAGTAQDLVVKHLAERMATRVGIAAGPSHTTKGGEVIPGIAAQTLMPDKETRQRHADELRALLGSKDKIRKAITVVAAAKKKAKAPKPEAVATPAATPTPTPAPKPAWQWGQPIDPDKPIAERIRASPAWERTKQLAEFNEAYTTARDAAVSLKAAYDKVSAEAQAGIAAKSLSEADKARLLADIKRLDAEFRAQRKIRDESKLAAADATARTLAPPPGSGGFVWQADFDRMTTDASREAAREAQRFLGPMLARGVGQGGDSVSFRTLSIHGDQRAYCLSDKREIYLARDGTAGTAVHEWGHQIERSVPGVREATVEFLSHRVGDEPLRKMSELTGKTHFGDNELGREDDFRKAFGDLAAYVGKHYAHGSEVISMGVEKLYNDPGGFAKADPEYCSFILGILDGSLRKP